MIGSDLLRYQDNQRFLCWDVETEGLSLTRARPWQIAYAICTIKGIESINVRYPLWEDLSVSEEAARVTRFDMKDYRARAEPADEVLKDFESILFDPSIMSLGHNLLGFDVYVVNTWRRLCGQKTDWSFVPRVVDTLALSRAYRYGHAPDRSNPLAWQYKMLGIRGTRAKGMGCSLGAMAREFGVEYDERQAHNASYDCHVNHAVFNKLAWSVEV